MKATILATLFLSAACWAQQPSAEPPAVRTPADVSQEQSASITIQPVKVTQSDIYCSGFITNQPVPKTKFVAGGANTPDTARFVEHDLIFLKGTDYKPGSLVSIIREWRNPDPTEAVEGYRKMMAEAGQPYSDVGYARVIEQRGDVAVARVEFNCEPTVPGDLVVPFMNRAKVSVRPQATVDRFPASVPSVTGRIIMARGGDQFISTGQKVFLSVGWEKGVHVGDYFLVTRGYNPKDMDIASRISLDATIMDDTQKDPPRLQKDQLGELPRRVVGELVVLCATPSSSTAMVTFMMEDIHPGDRVEAEPKQ